MLYDQGWHPKPVTPTVCVMPVWLQLCHYSISCGKGTSDVVAEQLDDKQQQMQTLT